MVTQHILRPSTGRANSQLDNRWIQTYFNTTDLSYASFPSFFQARGFDGVLYNL